MARLLVFAIAAVASTTVSAKEVSIDLNSPAAYRFEGWGTSLCWWANRVGDWPQDRLEALAETLVDSVDGLGLSVFRYNVGGGDNPAHDHMRAGGDVPGFQDGPDEPIDPTADANQRRVLLALIAQAETPIVEAFSNSPPSWMTRSGCSSGAADGGPNLPDERIDDFAEYLAEVALVYHDRYGVTFRTLDPFNEPNERWWAAYGRQEGCRIPESQQAAVIDALHAALARRGLADQIAISATDAHSLEATLSNVRALPATTLSRVGQINTHTYRGSKRRELREFASQAGKRLWQSESGPMNLDARSGDIRLAMMGRVVSDLNELRPAAWVMWQVIDDSPVWGCLAINEDESSFRPLRNYGLYAQFTRAIRPGDRIVPLNETAIVAAVAKDGSRAILIVVNDRARAQEYRLELLGVDARAKPITTRSGRKERNTSIEAARWEDDRLCVIAAPRSVTTVTVATGALGAR